jgi:hypothetical protein
MIAALYIQEPKTLNNKKRSAGRPLICVQFLVPVQRTGCVPALLR